jgi:D-alanine--poly(phosphoribitol) ligase subunit 2
MLDQVLAILAEITQSPQLEQHPDLRLYDLHLLDSFKTIELMLALSDRFGIEISPAEFDRDEWATPRAIAQDMERRVALHVS